MYIRDDDGLKDLIRALSGSESVAVDTEFMRERTYYARLCLIQIGTEDVSAIIDPLEVSNLDPLFELMADPGVMKVFHAGEQDLEIFYYMMGKVPSPVFDTQVAATLAGFPQQIGYGGLVKDLLGVTLDKSDTYTDWAKRPLSETQVEYALNDVRYLPEVYRLLLERLESGNRVDWLEPDFERLTAPESYEVDPRRMWRRVKRISSLKPRQLAVLREVTAWREREAQRKDVPRRWAIADESLVEIARRAPSSRDELASIRGVKDRLSKASYDGILDAVAAGLAVPDDELPRLEKRPRRSSDAEGAVDLLAALVRLRAREHHVAVPLLASRDDLERLAAGEREGNAVLTGWRRAIVGEECLELLDGKLALSLDDGALQVRRNGEAVARGTAPAEA